MRTTEQADLRKSSDEMNYNFTSIVTQTLVYDMPPTSRLPVAAYSRKAKGFCWLTGVSLTATQLPKYRAHVSQ